MRLSITFPETNEPRHEISNNAVCATSKGSDHPAHTRSLTRAFASRLNIKLLIEHHLKFLSLKGECTGFSESIHVKMFEITCRGSNYPAFAAGVINTN